jgi:uncharacterized protein YkwD
MRRIALLGGLCASIVLSLAGGSLALGPAAAGASNPETPRDSAARVLKGKESACVGADDPAAPVPVQEAAMECLVNNARREAGLPKLSDSQKLDGAAGNKAADILRCNEFSHQACGRDFLFWFRRSGYLNSRCWWAAENLAMGTGRLGSARSMLKAWLRSPGHRANLLSSSYNQTGISLRVGGFSGSTDAHVWVNHFGRQC